MSARIDGAFYVPALDEQRLTTQIRNLRKKENGGHTIITRRDGDTGLFLYRLVRGE